MFRYCPACASQTIRFEQNRFFRCPDCGFTYYHNTAAATACIVRSAAGLLFLVRGREPGKGKLDLPGGFVDPGEGALEGLRREFIEELGWDPLMMEGEASPSAPNPAGFPLPPLRGSAPQRPAFTFFASFPNTYPYKNISYNTCDLFFYLDAPDVTEKDLHPEADEISALRFIKPPDLDMDAIAFGSVKKAIRTYLDTFPSF
jgi:8-oxo-dGTP pyrophosphatase MutT (NUDIX family)